MESFSTSSQKLFQVRHSAKQIDHSTWFSRVADISTKLLVDFIKWIRHSTTYLYSERVTAQKYRCLLLKMKTLMKSPWAGNFTRLSFGNRNSSTLSYLTNSWNLWWPRRSLKKILKTFVLDITLKRVNLWWPVISVLLLQFTFVEINTNKILRLWSRMISIWKSLKLEFSGKIKITNRLHWSEQSKSKFKQMRMRFKNSILSFLWLIQTTERSESAQCSTKSKFTFKTSSMASTSSGAKFVSAATHSLSVLAV